MKIIDSWNWKFVNKYLVVQFNGGKANFGDGDDTEGEKITRTGIVDLDDPGHFEELSFLLDGEETIGMPYVFFAVGETLYGVDWLDTPYIIRCDIATRTAESLCTLPFSPGYQGSCIYDNKLYFCDAYDTGLIVSVDMETGEMETVAEAEPATELWIYPQGGYVFGSGSDVNPFPNGTKVYDLSGNLVDEIPYSDYDERCLSICYSIGDYVFANEYVNGTERSYQPPEWYLLVSEVGTENFRWHRWAPED